jgi:SAM-dependent methyltransferase
MAAFFLNSWKLSFMKTLLHVGCGPKKIDKTTKGFNQGDWQELRLDIDESVSPDLIGTMTDMTSVPNQSVDAIFSSHNIEHLYPHEVPLALAEFKRVLKSDGFVVLTCPDLKSVCELIVNDQLTVGAYTSPAGEITPLDILYGYRPAISRGNLYMAHRCGFTQKTLVATFKDAGFKKVASTERSKPCYDLWIVATGHDVQDEEILELAQLHFPVAR